MFETNSRIRTALKIKIFLSALKINFSAALYLQAAISQHSYEENKRRQGKLILLVYSTFRVTPVYIYVPVTDAMH